MLMECGNIDLNTWLKKKKTVNAWERKSYWKNMLEAVHTIHQHGICENWGFSGLVLVVEGWKISNQSFNMVTHGES